MRQTIGSTWLLQLMILFILLFVGFIILNLDYSKTIKLKNEVISIIEKNEGLNEASLGLVNNFLKTSQYAVTHTCDIKNDTVIVYGAQSLDNPTLVRVTSTNMNDDFFYCIKKYKGANKTSYYQISLFYSFNLPVIGDTSRFIIKGTTTNFEPRNENNLYFSN